MGLTHQAQLADARNGAKQAMVRLCSQFRGLRRSARQMTERTGQGVRRVKDLRADRRATQWVCGHPQAGLRRAVWCHGLRAAQLARAASRYRGLPEVQSAKAIPHGAEGATCSLDEFRRAEPARRAHLRRTGSAADPARQQILRLSLGETIGGLTFGFRCPRIAQWGNRARRVLARPIQKAARALIRRQGKCIEPQDYSAVRISNSTGLCCRCF